jgi:two-component system, OmpR family, sensor histidine kinase KdpD
MVERVTGSGADGSRKGNRVSGWAGDEDSTDDVAGPDYRRACELLWIAAHDLSAPLAAIQMHIRAKRHSPKGMSEADWQAAFERIEKIAASALRMLEDVLAVERLQPPGTEPATDSLVDVERVLGDVIVTQSVLLERAGCAVFVTRRDDLDRVVGRWNRGSIERLFGNLLQNVVRHAPGAPIEISFARRGEDLQIRFADGGPGLPVGTSSVPPPLAVSVASHGGHGLGLWIVSRTVAELGGAITMQSRAGKGLAFDIRLPFGA